MIADLDGDADIMLKDYMTPTRLINYDKEIRKSYLSEKLRTVVIINTDRRCYLKP